jgi:hypothetical protein
MPFFCQTKRNCHPQGRNEVKDRSVATVDNVAVWRTIWGQRRDIISALTAPNYVPDKRNKGFRKMLVTFQSPSLPVGIFSRFL